MDQSDCRILPYCIGIHHASMHFTSFRLNRSAPWVISISSRYIDHILHAWVILILPRHVLYLQQYSIIHWCLITMSNKFSLIMHTCRVHHNSWWWWHRVHHNIWWWWWWWRWCKWWVKHPCLYWWKRWLQHIHLCGHMLLYMLLLLLQVRFLIHHQRIQCSTTSADDDCVSCPCKRRPSPKVHRSISSYNWSQQSLLHCHSCGWAFWRTKWCDLSKRANRSLLYIWIIKEVYMYELAYDVASVCL